MEYGNIQDFYSASTGTEKSIVKFLVKGQEETMNSVCTVCAEIPNTALQFDMLKVGSAIGWKDSQVFIEIEGVQDVPFAKIDNSISDEMTFYEHLKLFIELEEKGSRGI